jgi:hypothetical protein
MSDVKTYLSNVTLVKQFRLSASDLERFEQAEGLEAHQQILEQIARNLPALTRTPIGRRSP